MLVINLADQLGNQMFSYASIKSIALDRGLDFGYVFYQAESVLCNDSDIIYGRSIDTIFRNTTTDKISDLSMVNQFSKYHEAYTASAYVPEVISLPDNTLLFGHYICPKYFEHRLNEVRKWFQFPDSVEKKVHQQIQFLRTSLMSGTTLISIHIRNNDDYLKYGYLLDRKYWIKAADKALSLFPNAQLVVFYDKKTKLVKKILDKYHAIEMHGSLIEDMYAISRCDAHIVCNSSFSIMSALLDPDDSHITICPSTYPIPNGFRPSDSYKSDWMTIPAQHDYLTIIYYYIWKLKCWGSKTIKKHFFKKCRSK